MRPALIGVLLAGIAGCTLIIGDIPVPDERTIDASEIAGTWYVYGMTANRAVHALVEIAADGAIDTLVGEALTQATLEDERYTIDLTPHAGLVSGRFDPRAGVGLMIEADPLGAPTWVVLVRRPSVRTSLLGGTTVQVELTDNGSPLGEFSRLDSADGDPGIYDQIHRYSLDAELPRRRLTVVPESEDAPRWVVRPEDADDDWLLSQLTDGAVGVHRAPNGRARGPFLLWSDPLTAELPAQELYCTGLVVEDGLATSRMRTAILSPNGIEWSSGGRGPTASVEGFALLTGDGSFFDDSDTLILPDAANRLFALMPLVPPGNGAAPTRTWGMALCLGLGATEPLPDIDAGTADMASAPDMGVADAQPVEMDAVPMDAQPVEMDATIDAAPPPVDAQPVDSARMPIDAAG